MAILFFHYVDHLTELLARAFDLCLTERLAVSRGFARLGRCAVADGGAVAAGDLGLRTGS